jgi:hypothetical protein
LAKLFRWHRTIWKYKCSISLLCKVVNIILESCFLFNLRCFLKYSWISALSKYHYFVIPANIFDDDSHSFSWAKRYHVKQLVNDFFSLHLNLNIIFCSFNKLVSNFFCIVYEADFIRRGSLIFVLYKIFHNIMAEDQTNPKIMKFWLFNQIL